MDKSLAIYREYYNTDGGSNTIAIEELEYKLTGYRLSATRMGTAPTISGTIKYVNPIEISSDDRIYVLFKGDRYYLDNISSTSYDQNTYTYSCNVSFTHERKILETVHFFDVPLASDSDLLPVVFNSDFSFAGDIKDLVNRLNLSLEYSKLDDYVIYVDDDVNSESGVFSATKLKLLDALKQGYETYKVPFFFNRRKLKCGVMLFSGPITSISERAFFNTSIKKVNIPNSVTSIGNKAFQGCKDLTDMTIPDSVTTIGEWAFYGGNNLESVTIGDSATTIGNNAFARCRILTSVYCKATTPPTGNSSMFSNNASGRKIYVPMESVEAYKSASGWKNYADAIVGYDYSSYDNGNNPRDNEIVYEADEKLVIADSAITTDVSLTHHAYDYIQIVFGKYAKAIEPTLKLGLDGNIISVNDNSKIKNKITKITGVGSTQNIPYYYPNPTPRGFLDVESTNDKYEVSNMMKFYKSVRLDETVKYTNSYNALEYSAVGWEDGIYSEPSPTPTNWKGFPTDTYTLTTSNRTKDIWINIGLDVKRGMYSTGACEFNWAINAGPSKNIASYNLYDESGTNYHNNVTISGNTIKVQKLPNIDRRYFLILKIKFTYASYSSTFSVSANNITITTKEKVNWVIPWSARTTTLDDLGISLKDSNTTAMEDSLTQIVVKRLPVSKNLLPSRYRESNWSDIWYNTDDEGTSYAPFDGREIEHIYEDEDIKPSIKNARQITNSISNYLDQPLEVAFDDDDDDEVYPEDSNKAGKYKHPYFFIKLRQLINKTNTGTPLNPITRINWKFNLFDSVLDGQEASLSFTTGHVAGCTFNIAVDEDTGTFNPVQVDSAGNLVRDEFGNVIVHGQRIESQQDTSSGAVWIALRKDINTMGTIMPSKKNNIFPTTDDKFVLLGIDMPEALMINAEKELENKIKEHLRTENSVERDFSVKASSIYAEENDDFYIDLDENVQVSLEFNGETHKDLYVSSYNVSMNDNRALPEIELHLTDEIKVTESSKAKTLKTLNSLSSNIYTLNKDIGAITAKDPLKIKPV